MEHELKFKEEAVLTKSDLPTSISLWRKIVNKLMTILIIVAVVLAVIPLVLILGDVLVRGAPALSIGFLTHLPAGPSFKGGGIANTIVGTFTMVGYGCSISIPIGVGAGIFFSECSSSKISTVAGFMNDVLTGFPTIVIGLFVFIILVLTTRHYSAFAGGLALSFIMIPIIARTTDESLKLVPTTLREASMALGVPRWRTIFRIVYRHRQNRAFNRHIVGNCSSNRGNSPITVHSSNEHFLCHKPFYTANRFDDCFDLTIMAPLTLPNLDYTSLGHSVGSHTAIMLALNLFVKLSIRKKLSAQRVE